MCANHSLDYHSIRRTKLAHLIQHTASKAKFAEEICDSVTDAPKWILHQSPPLLINQTDPQRPTRASYVNVGKSSAIE